MPSSGATALTNSDNSAPTTAIAASALKGGEKHLQIENAGSAALQWDTGGAGDWKNFPADFWAVLDFEIIKGPIRFRMILSGSAVTGVKMDVY